MRKVTEKIHAAFKAGKKLTVGNTRTDGTAVWLHGNKIVERREDGVYWTLAGWNTTTTRERVNGIAGARVHQRGGVPLAILGGSGEGIITNIDGCGWYKAN